MVICSNSCNVAFLKILLGVWKETGYLRHIHSFKGSNATTIRQKTSGKPGQNRTCKIALELCISKVIQTIGFTELVKKMKVGRLEGTV